MKRILMMTLLALATVCTALASNPWVPIVPKPPYKDPGGLRPKEPAQQNLFGILDGTAVSLHFEKPEGDASVTVTAVPTGEVVVMDWDTTQDLNFNLTSQPNSIEVVVYTSEGGCYSGTMENN